MVRFLQIVLTAIAGMFLFFGDICAQAEFETGVIGINLSDYGRVRVFAPDVNTRQIDRSSLLVGGNPNQVFDYWNDAETVDSARVIASPQTSDYELYGSVDNTYNVPPLPPAVLEKINVYGWTNGAYALAKFNVINMETSTLNAKVGMEIISEIDGAYGFESVEYLPAEDVVAIYRGTSSTYVGYKDFSNSLESLRSFEWYSGYNSLDDSLWTWLTYGAFDTLYNSGGDGAVSVLSQLTTPLNPGDSAVVYFGIAVGANETEMLANMNLAYDRYLEIISGISMDNQVFPASFRLEQNYPNPFNPETHIKFQIPKNREVTLKVYNLLGEEVATLVNQALPAGSYTYDFRADRLPSGLYFYTLIAGDFKETKKMVLVR